MDSRVDPGRMWGGGRGSTKIPDAFKFPRWLNKAETENSWQRLSAFRFASET